MNDKDNPFGGRGERTVIRPNPGLRRPQPPTPPGGSPPPAGSSIPAANAPAYQSAGVSMPLPTNYPYGQSPTQGGQPGLGGPSAGPAEDWIASSRPQDVGGNDPMQRAEDLRFDELVARHENPIMRAAGPLLLLLGRLRVAVLRASFASLMEQVAAAINFFDTDIRSAGIAPDQANCAKYIICATADDIVQNIPTEDRHVWTQYSMLSRFFGERVGGVRFFDELDRLKREPMVNYNLLELQHACLALGFQGVHRTSSGGASQLQRIQRDLYETLRRIKTKTTNRLSPRWQGQALPAILSRIRIPVWAVAGVVGLLMFGLFIFLRTSVVGRSEAAASEIIRLNPNEKVTLKQRNPSPPLVIAPSPAQQTQLQRIRAALAPEIAAGSISVEPVGKWIAVRIGNLILFKSGQADVLPQFLPVANSIAQMIDKETGPVQIIGHTDNQPLSPLNRFKNNQQLSLERAKSVAALVQPKLADPARITLDGRGPDEPIADNKTEDGRARNRRVEVLIARLDSQ